MTSPTTTSAGAENSSRVAPVAASKEEQMIHAATIGPSLSTVVEIGPDLNPSKERQTSFWSRFVNAATVVEEHLAEWFGLNESKYQWAVDEFMDRQMSGDAQVTIASAKALTDRQMREIEQQSMQRDTNQLAGF